MKRLMLLLLLALFGSGCAVINQDQIGVKRTFGKMDKEIRDPGLVVINPFFTDVLRLPTRTANLEVSLALPSREGLNVQCDISILYRIQRDKALEILSQSGTRYVHDIILPVFRSSAADVSARFLAKDMHTARRGYIEQEVQKQMSEYLANRGIIVEAVLMKSVQLPAGLARSIEAKLEAEQEAERLSFVIEQEKLLAERRIIEAEGINKAQEIISKGLNPMIIQYRQIEAIQKISLSPNAKIVFTSDGRSPVITLDGGK